ncbi:LamG-like jellyroll fold domain-containing protein [Tamlana sp. 2_MG-2023]|uniref:LamG-like jellyroll fold domain-containing protein n=1 Tax=unclassified Tamlana TaxID=2614803 RepID=UPI0026E1E8AE|nr:MULTISPECIES: LamG-like jellyroll fold domain-containing protein [unclassified Tamlana]MDO6759857.1 LamG-like jellyroll fold domain-containing protein [Tamlana sp. 2_MG-2023]MDO6791973.1 LamG-like jellyroll fold domain-containing protein [Tamlana sp. 1_MG-2023]
MKLISYPLTYCCSVFIFLFSLQLFAQTVIDYTSVNSFTVPGGVTSITVEAWGGGGAGANTLNASECGAGGGGGAYVHSTLSVTPGEVYDIIVGAGGEGNMGLSGTARDGGDSTFGLEPVFGSGSTVEVKAEGGKGAIQGNFNSFGAGGTIGGSIGDYKSQGGNGGKGGNATASLDYRSAAGGGAAGPDGDGFSGGDARDGNNPGGVPNNNVAGTSSGAGGFGVDPKGDSGAGSLGNYGTVYGGGGAGAAGTNQDGGNGANGLVRITIPPQEIEVTGLGVVIPPNNTPSTADNTDFKSVQVTSQTTTRTFTISNVGGEDLVLGSISLQTGTDFTIQTNQENVTIPAGGASVDVVIAFNTNSVGVKTDVLTINSNDPNTAAYVINIQGQGKHIFFDSDNDGVYDDVDLDDDNDGIRDVDEQAGCATSIGATLTSYKLLNETFGAGPDRSPTLSNLYDATTTYRQENGTNPPAGGNFDFSDGEYTVNWRLSVDATDPGTGTAWHTRGDIASYAWKAWGQINDHTGDTNGKMAIFNADVSPGVFYQTEVTGIIPGVEVEYSFWVINLDRKDDVYTSLGLAIPADGHRLRPEIKVEILALDGTTLIKTLHTGEITRCNDNLTPGDAGYNQCDESVWKNFTQTFTTTENAFIVRFTNEGPGGAGNDLALDDIEVVQSLCDRDGDGVADMFDLDSDNDGIPDAVEVGLEASTTAGTGVLVGAVDANGLKPNVLAQGATLVDTDGDLVPDYLDLDSDNDGIYDVDEFGGGNINNANFQNGDGDITGNGVGDGPESETFRERDVDGDGVADAVGFGDGILDIFDFNTGADYTAYGNTGQELATTMPNYQDPMSDGSTLDYTQLDILDPNLFDANGVLNDGNDADGDGVMDSRDGDDTVYGSPRDIDGSYSLYFDGRNDYVDAPPFLDAAAEATLMCWAKPEAGGKANFIMGQDNIYMVYYGGNNYALYINQTEQTKITSIAPKVWVHVALSYNRSGETVFYVNGEEVGRSTVQINTTGLNFAIGRHPRKPDLEYFLGEIDEVRVFDKALSQETIKRMIHQELDDTNFSQGKIIPREIEPNLASRLVRYYRMDNYLDDQLIDLTGNDDATIYNVKDILHQTAPMPYVTLKTGTWTTENVWEHGDVWDITTKQNNPDDASIIHVKHNLVINGTYDTQGTVGILMDLGTKIRVDGDKGLYNSWYIKLDGKIDLQGESQLIQTTDSELDVASAGSLERDQQGTDNKYSYNYWSSPVNSDHTSNPTNPTYTVASVLKDPTDPTNAIDFVGGYDGNDTATPLQIADYWINIYSNKINNNYWQWQRIFSTGIIKSGEGYTMKGPGTGAVTDEQNYVFEGMPNNGTIKLDITAGNEYLIGNPYSSAIDAHAFINDNPDVITGSLYYWEHTGGNSHFLADYEGGYATYSLSGATGSVSQTAPSLPPSIGAFNSSATPGQFIPVAQGFFVEADQGGEITFQNSQRVFEKENGGNSIFIKESSTKTSKTTNTKTGDTRPKIRLKYNSPLGYQRQLLATVDTSATKNIDWGYDARLIEEVPEDMSWEIENDKYIIQGIDKIDAATILPLIVKTRNKASDHGGIVTFSIDSLENDSQNYEVYLKDYDTYHDLKQAPYDATVGKGETIGRFALAFSDQTLDIEDESNKLGVQLFYHSQNNNIIINNPRNTNIGSLSAVNTLGQIVYRQQLNSTQNRIEIPVQLANGLYVFSVQTGNTEVSKKVIVAE